MGRVVVVCHNPSTNGELTWEGHEIVGYVDITPGPQPSTGRYFQGWNAPGLSDLNGTIDIVLAMYCPVRDEMARGGLNGFKIEEKVFGTVRIMTGQANYDIFVRGFALLKPGGQMLFPGYGDLVLHESTKEDLTWRLPPRADGTKAKVPNTIEVKDIGDVRPQLADMPESEGEDYEEEDYEEEEEVDDEEEDQNGGSTNAHLQERVPWLVVTKAKGGGRRRRRKTQRGRGVAMSRPAALPRVLIACHVPSTHGIVTWEGHEIVGYVDVQEGSSGSDGLPYYKGWSAIPASLKGTLDRVVSMGCPVVPVVREGRLTSFTEPPVESRIYEQDTYDIVNASLDLLRPGGILLFPRIDIVAPSIVTALKAKGATAEIVSIPKPRWFKHGTDVFNDAFSKETLPGLQITKGAAGGRRRYALRSRRRSIRS